MLGFTCFYNQIQYTMGSFTCRDVEAGSFNSRDCLSLSTVIKMVGRFAPETLNCNA